MPRIILFALVLFFSQSFGLENMRCGTVRFAENLKNPKKKMLAKAECVPENLYGNVYSKKTPHFIVYYTDSGPHAIKTKAYIDSVASYLEQAYNLHKNSLGMKNISGSRKTYHYRQNVPDGLFPIEVIDTGLLRGEEGEYTRTFGLTFPPKETEIVIENDFLYGADCSGQLSKQPFKSEITGKDYSIEWELILKATVFHELYHAFQSTYYNWTRYDTFWMEASATGVEEIGVPEVNDYINYLSYNFNNPGKSMESVEYDCSENNDCLGEYGYAALYLFLYSQIDDPRFDSAIWSYFSRHSNDNFAMQLTRLVDSLQKYHSFDKNAEDLWHEYAKRVFYSGSRAKFSPYTPLFWDDMPQWPNWRVNSRIPAVLQPGTIDFIRTANEPSTEFARKSPLKDGNSTVWALSRLLANPDPVKEIVAYPNPWNPKTQEIHFKNLPEKSKGIEIRSQNGALIARVDSLWKPDKKPAPGILYYRALPYGKNKVLIVQY